MPVSYTCTGLKELEQTLASLPGKLATTVVRKALGDAAKLGKAALKTEAQKHDDEGHIRVTLTGKQRTRHLSDSAIYVTRHFANGTEYVAVGFAWPEGAAGWLVEHGHRMVTGGTIARLKTRGTPRARNGLLTGAGRVIGFVKPHPIAAPAFESVVGQMRDTFTAGVASRAELAKGT